MSLEDAAGGRGGRARGGVRGRTGRRSSPSGANAFLLRQDTNSLWLTARLEEVGISVVRKSIVPDDPEAIGDEISFAPGRGPDRHDGRPRPTADDVTVAAVARRLEMPLARNEEYVAWMRERFARRGIRMPRRQREAGGLHRRRQGCWRNPAARLRAPGSRAAAGST
jgi:hypothetical protein